MAGPPSATGSVQKSLGAVPHEHLLLSISVKQFFAIPLLRLGNSGQQGAAFYTPQFHNYRLGVSPDESATFDSSNSRSELFVCSNKQPCYFLPDPDPVDKHSAP
ncbi:hypothetical protein XPA_002027 [Xanthoria parietina]